MDTEISALKAELKRAYNHQARLCDALSVLMEGLRSHAPETAESVIADALAKQEEFPVRYVVVSESHGLVWSGHDEERAEQVAFIAAVNSGRTVYLHDRQTEESYDA